MRRKMLIANWKLYKTRAEAVEFATIFKESLADETECLSLDLAICPPYPLISIVKDVLCGTQVEVGAQNVSSHIEGAFTGEVGVKQLSSLGCRYVIVGHSERRNVFGENDDLIHDKLEAIFAEPSLLPVLCIGEPLDIRNDGRAIEYTLEQLDNAVSGFAYEPVSKLVIAYEPIWAIGTGVNAAPSDAQTMCKAIRDHIAAKYSKDIGELIRILYGGSIKPSNWRDILTGADVDGGLVGGASLNPVDFYTLFQITSGG